MRRAFAACAITGAGAVSPVACLAEPSQQTIFSFSTGPEGARPRSGLIMDAAGALYGTTSAGGNTNACIRVPGCGVVFKMTPPQAGQSGATETVLYTFGTGTDGSAPYAGLLMDPSGTLYGATSQGGVNGYGVVFSLTPPSPGQSVWTETTLFSFSGGKDGGTPLGTLVRDASGALYGTTQAGGAAGKGVVFRLTPPRAGRTVWRETVLHHFHGKADGGGPVAGLAIDEAGVLYGSTPGFGKYGFGVAYSLTPPAAGQAAWKMSILHAFSNGTDGSYPQAPFLLDETGALFGTTSNEGAGASGYGVVFKLLPPARGKIKWREQVLFDFSGFLSTAANPVGPLTFDSAGALYGTTVGGGSGQMGVLFKLTAPAHGMVPWIESEPAQFFSDGATGAQPLGGVVVDTAGNLFGTTYVGGKYFYGAVFKVTQ